MITVACCVGAISLLLCGGHYASVAWPAIAYNPEIARPLRLDRPDSFGRWFMIATLTCSAGASLLIYQLRRYRNDDFRGHYRLWRLMLVVLIVASVNSVTSIIDWGGALLDAGFGKRVALTGSDWIRLVVSLAGAILAIRLVAEMRQTRFPLVMMVLTCAIMAIPQSARWNVLDVDSLEKWTLVTSAPLLACATLFIALLAYLRILYREVRQIEGKASLKKRFQRMRVQIFQRSDPADAQEDDEVESEDDQDDQPRRRWWRRNRKAGADASDEYDDEAEISEEDEDEEEIIEEPGDADSSSRERKRGWFGRRKQKASEDETSDDEGNIPTESEKPPKKRRRFSMRLAPPPNANENQDEVDPEDPPPEEAKRRGLGGWMRGKQKEETDNEQPTAVPAPKAKPQPSVNSSDDETIDPDDIDWSSMSKSERRRLRKKLKRQNRAA